MFKEKCQHISQDTSESSVPYIEINSLLVWPHFNLAIHQMFTALDLITPTYFITGQHINNFTFYFDGAISDNLTLIDNQTFFIYNST